ncbi:MAG: YciI family protein [Candidatus Nanopelagicales bacterium]
MTHYLMSVCYPAGAGEPEPAELERIMAEVGALNDDLKAAGAWVFGAGLHDPSTATVVTTTDAGVSMTDGPFIESKEQIGGFTIVDVADLDAALGWAERFSAATGTPIEVRPFAGIG